MTPITDPAGAIIARDWILRYSSGYPPQGHHFALAMSLMVLAS